MNGSSIFGTRLQGPVPGRWGCRSATISGLPATLDVMDFETGKGTVSTHHGRLGPIIVDVGFCAADGVVRTSYVRESGPIRVISPGEWPTPKDWRCGFFVPFHVGARGTFFPERSLLHDGRGCTVVKIGGASYPGHYVEVLVDGEVAPRTHVSFYLRHFPRYRDAHFVPYMIPASEYGNGTATGPHSRGVI